ncbi:MAG TPA: hypothetical protein VGZ48_11380 [Candidatus Acidoferrales bacterium]|jgi:hypothetical protein|nr:hypothetical protein [Candidatus Acidoferrales bacterium]
MKARIMMVAGLALLLVSVAGAQTKISGKANCAKPDVVGTTDAGDRAGHTLTIQKANCTWSTGMEMAGAKAKDGMDVEVVEVWSTRATTTGTHVSNMDNGDKFFVSFHDSTTLKDGAPAGPIHGVWSFTGGTGKLKGLTGKGTYTVTPNADGSGAVDVEGDYMVPTPAAPKPKTPK